MAENAVTLTFFARADKAEWSCVETVLFAGSKQKEAVAFCAVTRTSPHTAQMAPQMEISAAILRTGHGWDTSSWRRPVNQNKTCRTHRGVVLGHCISIAKMSSHLLCSVLMILATPTTRHEARECRVRLRPMLWTTIVGLQVVRSLKEAMRGWDRNFGLGTIAVRGGSNTQDDRPMPLARSNNS